MSSIGSFLLFFSAFLVNQYVINGLICKGCLELDELTFGKVLSKFPIVLVKFDVAFPYGNQHEEYAKFAMEISETNAENMIVALVGIKNYGEPTNNALAERFHIGNELPAIKLFMDSSDLNWVDFPKDQNVTLQNLRQFVRRNSNFKIDLDDCLKEFDENAAEFMRSVQHSSGPTNEAETIVKRARNEATKLDTNKQQIAQIYVLIMQRTLERGISFIGAEQMRLQQLLSGKISDQKRKEINQKLNILSSFHVIGTPEPRTEL